MQIELRMPTQLADRMRADLTRANPFGGERVGFLATRSSAAGDTLLVIARDYRPVEDKHYIPADDVGVRISSSAIRVAMEWGMQEQVGVWHVHAHLGAGRPPMMSGTDEADIPRLAEALTRSCPTETHGLMILNADRAMAEGWAPGIARVPVTVMEMGWPVRHLSRGRAQKPESDRYDRQDFLGPEARTHFGHIRIGIVGGSGGGSHFVQQGAHLGVGDITVFDPQGIDESNLNRLVGATEDDVVQRRPKVDIARRVATGVNGAVQFDPHKCRWQDNTEALRRCHVVLGAVDSFAERRELEIACRRFLIPYVDIGMDVTPGQRPAYRMAGQVIASIPGGPCMRCMGFLTEERLKQEAARYGAAGDRPQVVWANGVLASSGIGIAVDLITGWTGRTEVGAYLSYDGNAGLITTHALWPQVRGIACPHFPLTEVGAPTLQAIG